MLNTRIITYSLAVAGVLLIGSQVSDRQSRAAGPPDGLNVTVTNTPLPVTVTNPTVPPSTVSVGNSAALAQAIGQELRGTPVAFELGLNLGDFSVPLGQRLVIEYVSGVCSPRGPAQIEVTTNGKKVFFFTSFTDASPGGPQTFSVIGQSVTLYADGGSSVHPVNPNVCANVQFSGRLVTP